MSQSPLNCLCDQKEEGTGSRDKILYWTINMCLSSFYFPLFVDLFQAGNWVLKVNVQKR